MGLGLALPLSLQHPLPDVLRPVSFLPRQLQGPGSFPGGQGQARLRASAHALGQGTASAAPVGTRDHTRPGRYISEAPPAGWTDGQGVR